MVEKIKVEKESLMSFICLYLFNENTKKSKVSCVDGKNETHELQIELA